MIMIAFISTIYNCKNKTLYYSNIVLIETIITSKIKIIILIIMIMGVAISAHVIYYVIKGLLIQKYIDYIGLIILAFLLLLCATLANMIYVCIWRED